MVIYVLLFRDYVIVSSELLTYSGSPHQVVIEDLPLLITVAQVVLRFQKAYTFHKLQI